MTHLKHIFTSLLLTTVPCQAQTPQNSQQIVLTNGGPPGEMNLECYVSSKPNWYKDGTQINYGTENYQPSLYQVQGNRLINTQQVNGKYIGQYSCTGPSGRTVYNVQVPGASAGLSAGAIVGIVFAILFAVILIAVGLWFAYSKGYLSGGERDDYDDEKIGNDIDDDYQSAHGKFSNPSRQPLHTTTNY